jgi:parallel beta-helix repeat protein
MLNVFILAIAILGSLCLQTASTSEISFEAKERIPMKLVTGQEILVERSNGSIKILSDNDLEISEKYAIPRGINLMKVDKELFNVEYLLKEGFAKMQDYPLIVVFKDEKRKDAEKILRKSEIVREFEIIPAYAVRIPPGHRFYEIIHSDAVEKVWLDYRVETFLNQSIPLINATKAWQLGYNGSGIKIAILDTGINSSHGDFFFPNGTSKIIYEIDFTNEGTSDLNGHGTHVASIAAGTGRETGLEGVAPGALLMNIKVLNREGKGYWNWIISGIEEAVKRGADVISMSLGSDFPTDGSDPLSLACDKAAMKGIIVVTAAGNSGKYYGISSPGAARMAITVGASDKSEKIASFSSRGPTLDYRIKPEVVAPGVSILAASNAGGAAILSGTSMATPHVSGLAAILRQKGLNSSEIKDAIASTAIDLGYDVFTQGAGRINAIAALKTEIMAHPAVQSLGIVYEKRNFTVSFKNIGKSRILSLHGKLNCSGIDYSSRIWLNRTEFVLNSSSFGEVEVGVNVSGIGASFCSGEIETNYTVEGSRLKAVFGFIVPASEEISSCRDIEFPGNYSIMGELKGTQQGKDYCIGIFANNVVLEGRNSRIIGNRSGTGIFVEGNATLRDLLLENFSVGIHVKGYARIENSTLRGNWVGMKLDGYGSEIYGCRFEENGLIVSSYGNYVENSTVNGKPLVYLENLEDYTISDAGQVILAGCRNVTLKNLTIEKASIGIQLLDSENVSIYNSRLQKNWIGIYLFNSGKNVVRNVNVSGNLVGIVLKNSSGNLIYNNLFKNEANATAKLYAGIRAESKYRLVYLSFGFESMESDKREILMRRILNWLGAGKVILVGDERYAEFYASPLRDIGISFDYWNISKGVPETGILMNYSAVIWYSRGSLNEDERKTIGDYLERGGKIFIAGNMPECFLDEGCRDFHIKYLHSIYVSSEYQLNLSGIPSDTISDGLSFSIEEGAGIVPENATPIFFYSYESVNRWNSTKISGRNIAGGNWLGGNYWGREAGKGFSDRCIDSEGDGICDSPFAVDEGNIDYLPLKAFPDLAISIEAPKFLAVNRTAAIGIALLNIGIADSQSFNVSLFANSSKIGEERVERLNAGEKLFMNFSWTPRKEGRYELIAIADSGREVYESDEENNEAKAFVEVIASRVYIEPNATFLSPGRVFSVEICASGMAREISVELTFEPKIAHVSSKTYGIFSAEHLAIGNGKIDYNGISNETVDLSNTRLATIVFSVNQNANGTIAFNCTAKFDGSNATCLVKGLAIATEVWQAYDRNGDGKIETVELIAAIQDWLGNKIGTADLIRVIQKWLLA